MKIKTITCHDVYNYGASLQAYALQTYLQNKGHEVEIIDYLPYYRPDRLNWFNYKRTKGKIHRIANILPFIKPFIALYDHLNTLEKISYFRFYNKKKIFDDFKKNKLKCTGKSFHNLDELTKYVFDAELFIAGSDQIWNSVGPNGKDPSYYCAFAPKGMKCISYAASFGTSYIPENQKFFVSQQLKRFSAISVREASGVDIVKSLGFYSFEVMDPVFLLDAIEWRRLCKKRHKEKYLLVYDLTMNHPGIKKMCQYLSRKNSWKIYSINDFKICPYADYNINNAGPIDFLEWIIDAQYVICSSFHGTAFSILFQKQFYTFPLFQQKNFSRMKDFLHKLGLDDHFIMEEKNFKDFDEINYLNVNPRLYKLINDSKSWLDSQIIKN